MFEDPDRLAYLEARLSRLESRLESLEARLITGTPENPPLAVNPPPAPQKSSPFTTVVARILTDAPESNATKIPPEHDYDVPPTNRAAFGATPARLDFEQRIGRTWLPRLGAVMVSIAILFMLKWAYDRIGPAARLGLGFLGGAILMGAGLIAEHKKYRPLAAGLTAAGSVVFYLCTYTGYARFGFFARLHGLALMALITTATLLIAMQYCQHFVAFIGLAGGFLAPALLGRAGDDPGYWWSLLGYLAMLDLGLLWLTHFRKWLYLIILSYFATQCHLLFYTHEVLAAPPEVSLAIIGFFFVVFTVLGCYQQILGRKSNENDYSLPLVILNGLAVLGWVLAVFYRHANLSAWPGIGVLAVAAIHLVLGLILYARRREGHPVMLSYFGLCFAFATLAVPLQLKGSPLTFTWLAEAVFLVWLGRRQKSIFIRTAGAVVFVLALVVALGLTIGLMVKEGLGTPIWLPRELLSLTGVTIASILLACFYRGAQPSKDAHLSDTFAIFASLLLTALFSCQWWLGLSPVWTGIDRSWLHGGLFLLWAFEAIFLMLKHQPTRPVYGVMALIVLLGLAYKLLFNSAGHYFPLHRARIWFDGYLCQALGAIILTILAGYLWPAVKTGIRALRTPVFTLAAIEFGLLISLEYLTWPIHWAKYARGLGLSALWTFYAAMMIAIGLRWQRRGLRLFGLAVLSVALFKLLFFDLHWTGLYRVLSFLVVGLVSFVLAALYQKWGRVFFARDGQDTSPPGID